MIAECAVCGEPISLGGRHVVIERTVEITGMRRGRQESTVQERDKLTGVLAYVHYEHAERLRVVRR